MPNKDKIIYDGFFEKDKIPFLKFRNEYGSTVEIPTDPITARHILMYFSLLAHEQPKAVERGNEEPVEGA